MHKSTRESSHQLTGQRKRKWKRKWKRKRDAAVYHIACLPATCQPLLARWSSFPWVMAGLGAAWRPSLRTAGRFCPRVHVHDHGYMCRFGSAWNSMTMAVVGLAAGRRSRDGCGGRSWAEKGRTKNVVTMRCLSRGLACTLLALRDPIHVQVPSY